MLLQMIDGMSLEDERIVQHTHTQKKNTNDWMQGKEKEESMMIKEI